MCVLNADSRTRLDPRALVAVKIESKPKKFDRKHLVRMTVAQARTAVAVASHFRVPVRRFTSVGLFDWDSGRKIWPAPRPSMASAFAAVEPPHNSRRFSGDWWKDNERRAAAQRAEQQRIADYYARATKEQEDRENAEARERFLEQQQRLSVNRSPRP